MNILILGSGGREHALAWKLSQSEKANKIFVTPGNAGTSEIGENINLDINNIDTIKDFIKTKDINLVIIGPEDPLVNGIVDKFREDDYLKSIPIIGPTKKGALLEGSKDFAKKFMEKYNIPTAKYQTFTKETLNEGKKFLKTLEAPYVLKADGLAAGKGVLILHDILEAEIELEDMLSGKFGNASSKVVIEEFLSGIEASFFCITDGNSYVLLPEAKDYKKIGENDTGLNTGGMGAISPVPFVDDEFKNKVINQVVNPTIEGLKSENIDYLGFIFFGLINVNGNPYVIEYNCRLGDPETEVILARINSDLVDLFMSAWNKKLNTFEIDINRDTVSTVFLVSGGYPGNYEKGIEITQLDQIKDSMIFHAGTKTSGNKVVTNGGRVIAISSFGKTMQEALTKSYKNAEIISFNGKYFRKDIGFDLK